MKNMRWVEITVLGSLMLSTGGCAFFPSAGPEPSDIASQQSPTIPYALVKLTPEILDVISAFEPKGLAGTFTDRRPASNIKFGSAAR
jgi:polysaccharide export outer membrane protein